MFSKKIVTTFVYWAAAGVVGVVFFINSCFFFRVYGYYLLGTLRDPNKVVFSRGATLWLSMDA